MKTKFAFLLIILLSANISKVIAIIPDPLVITYSNGIKNNGQPGAAYTLISFLQDADNSYSQDTVMRFERTGTNNYTGVLWYNTVFNGGNSIQFGADDATQFKYLVVKAKQNSNNNFTIKLDQISPLTAPLQNTGIKNITASANKWKSYVYDLPAIASAYVNIPFNRLTIIPDYNQSNTSLCFINTVYFTNNNIVTITPATPVIETKSATTVSLSWTATSGASSYRIVDATTGSLYKENITGLSTTITGLSPNTTYNFSLVAVTDNVIESNMSTALTFTTRKGGTNYELIEDFEGTVSSWSVYSSSTIDPASTNNITNGINPSTKCAQVVVSSSTYFYGGIQSAVETIKVGPDLTYRYLHIKMKRSGGTGDFSIQLQPTASSATATEDQIKYKLSYSVVNNDIWTDYVFDLAAPYSGNVSTVKSMNHLIVKCTITNNGLPLTTQLDDIYLSNSSTPSTSNLTNSTILLTAGTGGSTSGSGIYYNGENITLSATPSSGYHFVNWTENSSIVSTNANYTFIISANRTLVANFEPNTVAVISGTTNASTITCTTCDVTVATGAELTVGTTKTLKSVTVAAGGKVTISSGELTVTNGITLQSTASGTATMLNSGTFSGTINAEQYLGSARNWYVSSPVSAATSPTTNITRYYEYVEAGNNADFSVTGSTAYWKGLNTGLSMTVGKGYIAQASAVTTVQFSGTPNNGNITTSFNLTRDDAKGKGFNLVGNPYPSYIDWSLVAQTNTNLMSTAWFKTKKTDLAGGGYTFASVNVTTPSSPEIVANDANTTITKYIPPTQAFWVRVKSGTSSTSMSFTNAMREHRLDNGDLMKAPKVNERSRLRLQLVNGIESDETLIYFDKIATNDFNEYDSPKMMNNSPVTPDLYTKAGVERLVINGMNAIANNMELPLGFSLNAAASLKLKATEMSNFPSGIRIYLLDKEESSQVELLPETEYSFKTTAATTNNESRFSLVFRAPGNTTGIDKTENGCAQVFVNAANQIAIIAPDKSIYAIYNAVGQKVNEGITTANCTIENGIINSGIYVVRVYENGISNSTRVILNGK